MDNESYEIAQYEQRDRAPYFSPAHIVGGAYGPFGVSFWMRGLPTQTCEEMTISAPLPAQKSVMTHIAPLLQRGDATVIGQAPTKGIYTGVEDRCT